MTVWSKSQSYRKATIWTILLVLQYNNSQILLCSLRLTRPYSNLKKRKYRALKGVNGSRIIQSIWGFILFPSHQVPAMYLYSCPLYFGYNGTRLYRISIGCHTVLPAPVWIRIPGPSTRLKGEAEYLGIEVPESTRILAQVTQWWQNIPNLYYRTGSHNCFDTQFCNYWHSGSEGGREKQLKVQACDQEHHTGC